jgi:hypothetical protein
MDDFIDIVNKKTDDELLKMVYEFAEWSPEMLISVEDELLKRNILPNDIGARKQELIEMEDVELSKGKEASIIGQVIGWVTILGFLGIFIGYHYGFSKIRNKYTGKQYFRYNESSRKHGEYLFYSAIVLLTLGILYKLLKEYSI